MYGEQENFRNGEYRLREFFDAIPRLPNLSETCMNNGWAICQRPKGTKNAFATGLAHAGEDYCGIPCMRSLLFAVNEAGIELEILQLGSVDWSFLWQSDYSGANGWRSPPPHIFGTCDLYQHG